MFKIEYKVYCYFIIKLTIHAHLESDTGWGNFTANCMQYGTQYGTKTPLLYAVWHTIQDFIVVT